MSVCSIRLSSAVAPAHPGIRRAPQPPAGVRRPPALLRVPTAAPLPVWGPAPAASPLLGALRRPQRCHAEAREHGRHESFSHNLFMDTIDYHKAINMHPAMEKLRGTKVDSARIYWRILVDKLAFHEALERLLARHKDEPLLEPFHAPVLARSKRLRQDLRALSAKPHAHIPKPAPASPAARAYIEAMDLAARKDARALAAHAWLHYLGDMHGGQLMRGRLAERHGTDTVSSFEFTESVDTLKRIYGQALDAPLSEYEKRLLKEQAVEVYTHSLNMHDAWVDP